MTDYPSSRGRQHEYQTTRRHIPDDSRFHTHRHEILKPRECYNVWVWRTNITECPERGMNSVFPCQKNIFNAVCVSRTVHFYIIVRYHHHKHQVLDPLIRSVPRVTVARSNVSSVFLLSFFLVVCSGMISRGFGFVAFFASVKTSLVCIHLSCPVCM